MTCAIVIPSIGVDHLLERCVAECRRNHPDVEILALVDNGHGAERISDAATVVVTGPSTIAAKRNLGVASTSAEYVAFIDSDAYPAPGWLQRAAQLLDEDHRRGAVGGPNVSPPEESRSERLVGRAHRSFLVDGWWTFRKVPGSAARDVDNLPSCNLVVRRSVYESLGGMNEQLFTGEDVDFCTRLINSGWRMRFDPSVLVFHKNRSMRAFVVQRFTFGVAMVPLWRRAESPEPAYNAISIVLALFVLFVASGPLGFVLPTWGRWWRWAMTVYAAVIAAEAVRHAATVDEVPGVAAALTVGNLAPGVGVVAMALGAVPSLKGIYRNDR